MSTLQKKKSHSRAPLKFCILACQDSWIHSISFSVCQIKMSKSLRSPQAGDTLLDLAAKGRMTGSYRKVFAKMSCFAKKIAKMCVRQEIMLVTGCKNLFLQKISIIIVDIFAEIKRFGRCLQYLSFSLKRHFAKFLLTFPTKFRIVAKMEKGTAAVNIQK